MTLLRQRMLDAMSVRGFRPSTQQCYSDAIYGVARHYRGDPAKPAQRAYAGARQRAGITKSGGIHTLRHCFATHLLEGGVDPYIIIMLGKAATKTPCCGPAVNWVFPWSLL